MVLQWPMLACAVAIAVYSNMNALEQPEQSAWRVVSANGVRIDHADRFSVGFQCVVEAIDVRVRLESGENELTVALFEESNNRPVDTPFWSGVVVNQMRSSEGGSIVRFEVTNGPVLKSKTNYWLALMAGDEVSVSWFLNTAEDRDWHAERNGNDLGWFLIGPPNGRGTFPRKGEFRIIAEPIGF